MNSARRFLHSSTSSASSSASTDTAEVEVRLGWLESKDEVEEEEGQEVGFVTPPSSPEGSCASDDTMATCEGGGQVYVVGGRASQEDRRVVEATAALRLQDLQDFPRVAG